MGFSCDMKLKLDDLTDHQRRVLFRLVDETKDRLVEWLGVYVFNGERSGPLFISTLVLDRTGNPVIPTSFHPDTALLQLARANSLDIFTTMENLQVLANQGYLDLAPKQHIEDPSGTLWKLLLSQKAFDHYALMHQPKAVRFLHWLWRQIRNLLPFLKDVKELAG